jgi:large subunit ribosomal protein L10
LTVSLNLNDKKAVVAEVSAQVAAAQTIVVAEYRGIQVGHLTQLRAKARAQGVYLRVLKNTLARRAVEGTAFAALADQMSGPLIYSISADAVAAAKVIADFAKTNDKLVIKAGNYAGKPLDTAGVAALASIPSREILIAQLLGVMLAPVRALHVVWLPWQRKKKLNPQRLPKWQLKRSPRQLPKHQQRLNCPRFFLSVPI